MILLASGRCDIPAFYSEWFFHRLKEGFLDVRNPYNPHQISRIYLNKRNVDGIAFCTKNPIPMLPRLDEIHLPYLFHITLTPYQKDMEPGISNKSQIIEAVKELSKRIGKERVFLRYDPILINSIYTVEYHMRAFTRLCEILHPYISGIIISFVDDYKNLRKHEQELKMIPMEASLMRKIAEHLGPIAKQYQISVQTCAEQIDLREYGISNTPCFERHQLSKLFHKTIPDTSRNGVRANCACLPTVDIGDYNCCSHHCKYCYANYDETKIHERMQSHDPLSTVLIGKITKEDTIVVREEPSIQQAALF